MIRMHTNYETYDVEKFMEDEYFIGWIRQPNEDSDKFWKDWESRNPANLKDMQEAAVQLKSLFSVDSIEPGKDDADQVWERVKHSISGSDTGKVHVLVAEKKSGKSLFAYKWAAAVAAILILSVGGYFLIRQNSQPVKQVASAQQKSSDIAPGGNKAILTLADGSKIILDSANNGAITKQGNITVIKLNDGEIAYKSSTLNSKPYTLNYNTISTPRGGQYQLVLADGSKVWLNAESSLRYPTSFPGHERKVELTGEGYFEVAHNASKPFRVSVNDMTVEVLGTHFNINAYSDEDAIKTTLLQGSVRVSEGNESVKIRPGQQARLETGNNKLQTINNVNVDEVIAWKNGYFSFGGTGLKEVMRQLARWYDVDVVYEGNIRARTFGGGIARDLSLQEVLKVLKESNVNFQVEGRKIIVKP